MSVSDETLAAYVDGELDAAACAEIEEAVRRDPSIGQRIDRYRTLRSRVRAAYAAELGEPVPDRLLAALRSSAPDAPARRYTAAVPRRYALAASLLIAAGLGFFSWRHFNSTAIESLNGTLIARGALAAGLSDQLSGAVSSESGVRIGLSFVSKSGQYCRAFSFSTDAGLACRDAKHWEIRALAKLAPDEGAAPEFRTAGSGIPAKVLEAARQEMAGEPLDRAGEMAARGRNWSNPPAPVSIP